MNILFDFNHPVDVNFFRNAIKQLDKQKHNIFLTFRPRGSLEKILKYELPGFPTFAFGKHGKNIISKFSYNLLRESELLSFYRRNNIQLTCGFGPLTTISSKIYGIPALSFEDDYEYKIPFYYAKLFATRHIMPSIFPVKGKNVFFFNGFKELAYLHPQYYTPNLDALQEYDLKPKKFVFIREVANVSLNYRNKKTYLLELVKKIKSMGLKIVLSLEDKSIKNQLQEDCIILKEPVKDINSILAFAASTITSGDTMARESSLLGTPTIYTGEREMLIHKDFYEIGIMYNEIDKKSILKRVSKIIKQKDNGEMKSKIDQMILNKWDNMTDVILKHINDYIK